MILAGCIVILSPFSVAVGITVGIVWITTFGVVAVVGLVLVINGDPAFTDCTATVEIFCPREVITTGTCIATRTVLGADDAGTVVVVVEGRDDDVSCAGEAIFTTLVTAFSVLVQLN